MGDPHKNIWGGKNNSWGHKPKKNKTPNSSKNDNKIEYEPSKLFNIFAAGCVLFLLGSAGLTGVKGAILKAADAKEKVDTAKEVAQAMPIMFENSSNTGGVSGETDRKSLADIAIDNYMSNFEIGAEDVSDMLDYVYASLRNDDVSTTVKNTVFIDYEDADTVDEFKKSVLNKESKYKDTVTFSLIAQKFDTDEQAEEMRQNVLSIVRETSEIPFKDGVSDINVTTITDEPNIGNFLMAVTFVK